MEPTLPQEPPINPIPPTPEPAIASSFSMGRMVLISLGIFGLGLAIAFGGFYLGQTHKSQPTPTLYQKPTSTTNPSPTSSQSASPTGWQQFTNANGYTISFPPAYKAEGVGMDPNPINTTEVQIGSNSGTGQAIHISLIDQTNTIVKGKTLQEVAQADYNSNLANKNTYVATIKPLTQTKIGGHDAYTYTITSHGYSGTVEGWFVDAASNYTVVETTIGPNYMIIVYDDTPELASIVNTLQFTK